jgi:hypothetical protein
LLRPEDYLGEFGIKKAKPTSKQKIGFVIMAISARIRIETRLPIQPMPSKTLILSPMIAITNALAIR